MLVAAVVVLSVALLVMFDPGSLGRFNVVVAAAVVVAVVVVMGVGGRVVIRALWWWFWPWLLFSVDEEGVVDEVLTGGLPIALASIAPVVLLLHNDTVAKRVR